MTRPCDTEEPEPMDAMRETGGGVGIGAAPVLSEADRVALLALDLRALAFRMQCRVDAILERDGTDGAVTGPGIGIGYLFARDIAETLNRGANFVDALCEARPLSEWHEDIGPAMWWRFPIDEPPYVGTPLDVGMPITVIVQTTPGKNHASHYTVGGWPGYHTHWTPLPPMPEPQL